MNSISRISYFTDQYEVVVRVKETRISVICTNTMVARLHDLCLFVVIFFALSVLANVSLASNDIELQSSNFESSELSWRR